MPHDLVCTYLNKIHFLSLEHEFLLRFYKLSDVICVRNEMEELLKHII
jgi:hypothetical protein